MILFEELVPAVLDDAHRADVLLAGFAEEAERFFVVLAE